MSLIRSRHGFSLIELLTVIAIIAILAAIIFPVMNMVKARAKVTQCQTNLHEIAMALKMFKEDNRHYPASLGGYVQPDSGSPGSVMPMDRTVGSAAYGDGLYPEYTKSIKTFHCGLSPITSTTAVTTLTLTDASGNPVTCDYYAYDSYDVYSPEVADRQTVGVDEIRYTTTWAATRAKLGPASELPPYGGTDSQALRDYDYGRQLRFRYTSDDTVVTWCTYHERAGSAQSKVPVLFLSGTCDMMPASEVNTCKWRIHPKT